MRIEGKFKMAVGIANLVEYHLQNLTTTEDATFWVEAFQNGREQGTTICFSSGMAKTKHVSISECRNSDDIVVFPDNSAMQGLDEDSWKNVKRFGYGEYTECVKWICEYFFKEEEKEEKKAEKDINWQLYSSMKGSTKINEILTNNLNLRIMKAMTCKSDREKMANKIRNEMFTVMDAYKKFGARDSEPESVLVDQINKALGTEIDRF